MSAIINIMQPCCAPPAPTPTPIPSPLFIVNNGVPIGALGAPVGAYCFDSQNGGLYGPRPDWGPSELQEWNFIGFFMQV